MRIFWDVFISLNLGEIWADKLRGCLFGQEYTQRFWDQVAQGETVLQSTGMGIPVSSASTNSASVRRICNDRRTHMIQIFSP